MCIGTMEAKHGKSQEMAESQDFEIEFCEWKN